MLRDLGHPYASGQATIKRWLAVFLRRFFETSQFKRSALSDAPKVGSGGSLSPRSAWRAPRDGHADAWLQELEQRFTNQEPMTACYVNSSAREMPS